MPLITSLNKTTFQELLHKNNGIIILKFGADWCAPCKRIHSFVHQWFEHLQKTSPNITLADIDVDENIELYSFLKTKRMINGVPTVLAYYKGNVTYIADDSVIGADTVQLQAFFQRALVKTN